MDSSAIEVAGKFCPIIHRTMGQRKGRSDPTHHAGINSLSDMSRR